VFIVIGDVSLPFCLSRQTVLLTQCHLPTEIYIMTVNFSSEVITQGLFASLKSHQYTIVL